MTYEAFAMTEGDKIILGDQLQKFQIQFFGDLIFLHGWRWHMISEILAFNSKLMLQVKRPQFQVLFILL
jgi:hypothetical protein